MAEAAVIYVEVERQAINVSVINDTPRIIEIIEQGPAGALPDVIDGGNF